MRPESAVACDRGGTRSSHRPEPTRVPRRSSCVATLAESIGGVQDGCGPSPSRATPPIEREPLQWGSITSFAIDITSPFRDPEARTVCERTAHETRQRTTSARPVFWGLAADSVGYSTTKRGAFLAVAGDTQPEPFFEVVIDHSELSPALMGLCAGFERGEWRLDQLAGHLIEWLPDFALSDQELSEVSRGNMVKQLRKAARLIYDTKKFDRRGEFGELVMHAVLRQCFGSLPAIKKIFYKDSRNDTVKGFDAVHVVPTSTGLELWLGEVKFYDSITRAIKDVVIELHAHTETDYLRNEFMLITNKLDKSWPYADKLAKLTSPNTSLDEVFDACVFPVLLTYDSTTVQHHVKATDEYRDALRAEFRAHHTSFCSKVLPKNIRLHLILLPLKNKHELVQNLHARLKSAQDL